MFTLGRGIRCARHLVRRVESSTVSGGQTSKREFSASTVSFDSVLLKYQKDLPRFPIPKLEDTLAKYKEASKPLLPHDEWQSLCKTVDTFQKADGPELQRLLLEVEKESPYNWIEGYWQSMYLDLRCPMPINVSPYLLQSDDPNPTRNRSQVLRAASVMTAAARLFLNIQKEELQPDISGDAPLCMNGFLYVAGTRIPKLGRDEFFVAKNSRHMTVISHNIPYHVEVIHQNGMVVPESEIARQLQSILDHSSNYRLTAPYEYSVGLLTTENRDTWANARQLIFGVSEENKRKLVDIESSLLVICLDEVTPKDETDFSKIVLMGNAQNRYYDKLQVIVAKNGQVGWNMEHTGFDGQITGRVLVDIFNDIAKRPLEHVNFTDLPKPQPLFISTTPQIRSVIGKAQSNWNEFTTSTDLSVLRFRDFGKNLIKNFKVAPDAFFQTAAQLTTKRVFGKCLSTYESSSVRNYSHGRTETIRPLTVALKDFVDKFDDPNVPHSAKFEALHTATKMHQVVVKGSKTGEGIDRHLQGLYYTALQKTWRIYQFQMPSFFTDGTYSNYMSNKVSTSNIGGDQPALSLFGFGAVHAEGVGLGYMINSDSLVMSTTSYTQKAGTFVEHMNQSLCDLRKFLENPPPNNNK